MLKFWGEGVLCFSGSDTGVRGWVILEVGVEEVVGEGDASID
jgi:hypothetical protein